MAPPKSKASSKDKEVTKSSVPIKDESNITDLTPEITPEVEAAKRMANQANPKIFIDPDSGKYFNTKTQDALRALVWDKPLRDDQLALLRLFKREELDKVISNSLGRILDKESKARIDKYIDELSIYPSRSFLLDPLFLGTVGATGLTGLGLYGLANTYPNFPFNNKEKNKEEEEYDEDSPIVPQEQLTNTPVIESASKPTLEQRYASQGKPYDSRPLQSYPVEEDLDASQIPLDLQETNSLAKSIYDSVYSNTPVEAGSDNFTAPRELPTNGETLNEYNSDSTPKSGVVLTSDDTTSVNEPRVLNKPANTRKPVIVNKPQKQITPAPTPVSAESALVQNALSKEDLAKRDRAFRNAKYAALNANLAGREDALQRARYQSLMNSGLRGMSPSEAIKSGLLTPEQAYVLMRGPF